jgi:serine O-acetyltransferase
MDEGFYKEIFGRQQVKEPVPNNETISSWAAGVICLLYPELSLCSYSSIPDIKHEFKKREVELTSILNATKACWECNNDYTSRQFFESLPEIYRILNTDVEAILEGDPAARTRFEIIRAYPGFYALCFYRIAHSLHTLDVPLLPRILTEYAHSKTGIDIHPAAEIDEHFHIDHGTGIVIGETATIGKHVKLYQGVTLGALSVDKSMAYTKRHPTVEDYVVIYSGATILGGDTVIGHHSIIGGNVWLTKSVLPGSQVYHKAEVTVTEGKILI